MSLGIFGSLFGASDVRFADYLSQRERSESFKRFALEQFGLQMEAQERAIEKGLHAKEQMQREQQEREERKKLEYHQYENGRVIEGEYVSDD